MKTMILHQPFYIQSWVYFIALDAFLSDMKPN